MKRKFGKAIQFGVGAWCIVLALVQGDVWGQSNHQQVVPPKPLPDQAIIDEINEIRQQLGGGIAEQLQGIDLGHANSGPSTQALLEKEFEQELSRLSAQNESPHGNVQRDNVIGGKRSESKSIQLPPAEQGAEPIPHSPANQSIIAIEHSSHVQTLRSAARRFDEIAAELEHVGLFDEADSVRNQALEFWHQARGRSATRGRSAEANPVGIPRNR